MPYTPKQKSEHYRKYRDYYREKAKRYRAKKKTETRDYQLIFRYGISLEDYTALLAKQNGLCAICRNLEPRTKRSLAVDHDHETGEIRGLLCSDCNLALGLMNDDPNRLIAASNYLKKEGTAMANLPQREGRPALDISPEDHLPNTASWTEHYDNKPMNPYNEAVPEQKEKNPVNGWIGQDEKYRPIGVD